jgi:hypothetical protein
MPRAFLAIAAALLVLAFSPFDQARAQNTGLGADPFSLYYGYYLPHAAAMAAQPSPLDSINQATMRRQQNAQTDRSTLYDPISPYGDADSDTLSPYSSNRRSLGGLTTRTPMYDNTGNPVNPNAKGHGPTQYYNRIARYHPTMKIGRGPNHNIGNVRYKRGGGIGGGGGAGMPSMPSMPGPR